TPGNGFRVSHAHNRNKRRWLPNIQNVRVLQPGGNRKKIRVCTSCIRSGKTLAAS
ncbi:MAG: 50S ribosomal protein L28, partial [SAR324 cluster bacterium]|nr:50S ribosomal protein L28 [SAR324 cluster bacterium]